MSAIAGIIDWERGASREQLGGMLEAMRHRGDSVSMDIAGPAALGRGSRAASLVRHRLEGKDYIVLLDGEIANREELALRLDAPPDDAEGLILRAYAEYGVGFPRALRGAFAIALWDIERQRLTLARDRFGMKPLFFYQKEGFFCFSSEIKGLLAHPLIPAAIDMDGIAEIFALLPARTPGCGVFRDVSELLPAHIQTLEREYSIRNAYWRLSYREHTDDAQETADTIRAMITRSVLSQSAGHSMLSGGVDSSILSAIEAQSGGVRTYSVHYDENSRYFASNLFQPDSDDAYIDRMAEHLQCGHTRVFLGTEELAGALEEAMRMRDLPGMADIDASLLLFSRRIAKETDAVLSGEGSDEIFGGYPWFYRTELAASDQFPWSPNAEYRQTFLSGAYRGVLSLRDYARGKMRLSMMTAPEYGGDDPNEARIRSLMYLNMRWFMANLIDRSDRMGSAAGLTIRMPYASEELLCYVFDIPWEMKFLGGQEKGILRKAFEGIVPDDVLFRKKSPYPKTFHPGYTEAAKALLRAEMRPGSPLLQLVNETSLEALLDETEIGRPWYGQLMAAPQLIGFMAQLGMWLRTYNVKILV